MDEVHYKIIMPLKLNTIEKNPKVINWSKLDKRFILYVNLPTQLLRISFTKSKYNLLTG